MEKDYELILNRGIRFGKSLDQNICLLKQIKEMEAGKTILISYADRDIWLKVDKVVKRLEEQYE